MRISYLPTVPRVHFRWTKGASLQVAELIGAPAPDGTPARDAAGT
jgi:hypothetical protein